jgi:type VI secretion system secreted protein VgrG
MNLNDGNHPTVAELASERQGKRLLRMRFPQNDGPAAVMLANTLVANESLSRDYEYVVEVLSDDASIRHDELLGKMVTIELVREDGTLRYFNGYVFEFRRIKTDGGFAFYQMALAPWLAYLRLRQDNAAFHNLTLRDLTGRVCEQYLKRDWRYRIAGEDAPVTYCCQHNESEHNFLHRHWESRGWHYSYEHRADGHTLVLSDNSTLTAGPIEGGRAEMPFQHQAGAIEDDGIHAWSPTQRITSDRTVVASFNFKHPRPKLAERTSAHGNRASPQLEVYENMGSYGFRHHADGEAMAQLRLEELEARRDEFLAAGNDRTAEPGRWFILSGHFAHGDGAGPAKFLITSVRHKATNNYQDGRHAVSHYGNEVACIAHSVPWRPGREFNSVTPRIHGVQTAIVVGPPGEEIYTDEYGRVKVQFHWDRKGEFDDRSSPWVRVVSSWAGANFGQISVPRVGMEVVVQFLDGNIDHPLVTGCVYNANNMPPWSLPENKTQSGIVTRSSKKGRAAHANALRFEDKLGKEEVWLHAEKDQRIEVENDELHWVGHDRQKTVDHDERVQVRHDRSETVGHDERISVLNDRHENVERDETIVIGNNRTETVGKNEKKTIHGRHSERVLLAKDESIGLGKALTVGGIYQVTVAAAMNMSVGASQSQQVANSKQTRVGRSYVIDAGDQLSINVGAASFRMSSDGTISLAGTKVRIEASGQVTINGSQVDLNNGGGGGKGNSIGAASGVATAEDARRSDAPANAPLAKQSAGEPEKLDSSMSGTTPAPTGLAAPLATAGKPGANGDNRALLNAADHDMRTAPYGSLGEVERPTSDSSPFDSSQQARINNALDNSRGLLLEKSNSLRRWNQNDKDDFYKAYGTDSDAARDIIRTRTEQMLVLNKNTTIDNFKVAERPANLSEAQFSNTYAYVYALDDTHAIHLAPSYWQSPETGLDSQSSILTHEMSHFYQESGCIPNSLDKFCGTIDGVIDPATGRQSVDASDDSILSVYGPQASSRLTPEQALYHADSYEYYLSDMAVPRQRIGADQSALVRR